MNHGPLVLVPPIGEPSYTATKSNGSTIHIVCASCGKTAAKLDGEARRIAPFGIQTSAYMKGLSLIGNVLTNGFDVRLRCKHCSRRIEFEVKEVLAPASPQMFREWQFKYSLREIFGDVECVVVTAHNDWNDTQHATRPTTRRGLLKVTSEDRWYGRRARPGKATRERRKRATGKD